MLIFFYQKLSSAIFYLSAIELGSASVGLEFCEEVGAELVAGHRRLVVADRTREVLKL